MLPGEERKWEMWLLEERRGGRPYISSPSRHWPTTCTSSCHFEVKRCAHDIHCNEGLKIILSAGGDVVQLMQSANRPPIAYLVWSVHEL
jgi:hypothetical protein